MSHHDYSATLAAIGFIAARLGAPDFHRVNKLLYFADKLHLERYGRQITKDHYIAMKFGPVASGAYDLLQLGQFDPTNAITSAWLRMTDGKIPTVEAVQEPDLNQLSDSDIECLSDVIEKFGQLSFSELTEQSHDAAWNLARSRLANSPMLLEEIAATLPNAEIVLTHLRNPHP
jgi:uncharacterized phage-associated protein